MPQGKTLEGYFFPDTYFILKNGTVKDVYIKAMTNFEQKFADSIQSKIGDRNFFDVLTMASIVAKEGKTYEDKRMIAGVFYNRLEAGIGLGSDPTVNYITRKVTDNPTLNDTSIASPYNTYKYRGLPPGPISNPGLDDILATLEYTKHDYLYFLNTQDGKLIFSKSFEEHKANRIKYGQ